MTCTNGRPWKVIVTDDPDKTLGEGRIRHFRTLLAAANALANGDAPYQQVIYDDCNCARELAPREQRFVENVCGMLGFDVEPVDDAA